MMLISSVDDFSSLKMKILSICNFTLEINDILPRYLCEQCNTKLNIAYDFQQLSNRTLEFINICIAAFQEQESVTDVTNNTIKNKDHHNSDNETEFYKEIIISNEDTMITQDSEEFINNENGICNDEDSMNNEDDKLIGMRDGVFNDEDLVNNEDNELIENEGNDQLTIQNENNRVPRLSKHSAAYINKLILKFKANFFKERKCLYCRFIAKNCRILSVHMTRIHRTKKKKWCYFCNQNFVNIKEHLASMHENEYRCPLCKKVCKTASCLVEHLQRHSDVNSHYCTICCKSFETSVDLRDHLLNHSNAEKFKNLSAASTENTQCMQSTVNDLYDEEIENSENVEVNKKFGKTYCDQCKKNVRSLSQHNKQHHQDISTTTNGVVCPLCGKLFRTKSKLSVHLEIHTGEFRYPCSNCNAKFRTKTNLVVHKRIHTGEKPHICKFCGKGFTQTSILNVHMKLHTGKPEKCTLCPKRFCRRSELRAHMRTHTGEKPYECSQCGKSFKQKSHLQDHSHSHISEKRFQCGFCDKLFKRIGTLKIHVKGHNGNYPYECEQCEYKCSQKKELQEHLLNHKTSADSDENSELL